MSIYLGNIQFSQVRSMLGYQLTDEDRNIWDKYHNSKADLSGMDSCFHVFYLPLSIHVKGDAAREAIIKMFTEDKLVEPMGEIEVCMVK